MQSSTNENGRRLNNKGKEKAVDIYSLFFGPNTSSPKPCPCGNCTPGPSTGPSIPSGRGNTTVDTMDYITDVEDMDLGTYNPPWEPEPDFVWTPTDRVSDAMDVDDDRYSPFGPVVQDLDRDMIDPEDGLPVYGWFYPPLSAPVSDLDGASTSTPMDAYWSQYGLAPLPIPAPTPEVDGGEENDPRFQPRLRSLKSIPSPTKPKSSPPPTMPTPAMRNRPQREEPLRMLLGRTIIEVKKGLFVEVVQGLDLPLPREPVKITAENAMVDPGLLMEEGGVDWERLDGMVAEWEAGLEPEEEDIEC